MLTQERLREVLRYDANSGAFYWRLRVNSRSPAGSLAGTKTAPRQTISVDGERYFAHRLVWLYVHGRFPLQIDHVNRNELDNRLANLREASQSQNNFNCGPRRPLPPGVDWYKKTQRWRARIKASGVEHRLGYFLRLEDAVAARQQAENLHFANFQRHSG